MTTVVRPIHFVRRGRRTKAVSVPDAAPGGPAQSRARVARLMALAIHFDGMLRKGVVADQSALAQICEVTQPRITQIMNLLHRARHPGGDSEPSASLHGPRPRYRAGLAASRRASLVGTAAFSVETSMRLESWACGAKPQQRARPHDLRLAHRYWARTTSSSRLFVVFIRFFAGVSRDDFFGLTFIRRCHLPKCYGKPMEARVLNILSSLHVLSSELLLWLSRWIYRMNTTEL
ncbi:MAG: hypothetical protein HRU76_01275 [Phycisphaeraceae bacterium]|nr:MAG: hypothetical protein HRU76_01275 [Phycisphaeraceae bacterium]